MEAGDFKSLYPNHRFVNLGLFIPVVKRFGLDSFKVNNLSTYKTGECTYGIDNKRKV
jgi:hypothetical protein